VWSSRRADTEGPDAFIEFDRHPLHRPPIEQCDPSDHLAHRALQPAAQLAPARTGAAEAGQTTRWRRKD